jgi:hypothetical protein
MKLIFGMQPNFDPTNKTTSKINGRRPNFFFLNGPIKKKKKKDDLKKKWKINQNQPYWL